MLPITTLVSALLSVILFVHPTTAFPLSFGIKGNDFNLISTINTTSLLVPTLNVTSALNLTQPVNEDVHVYRILDTNYWVRIDTPGRRISTEVFRRLIEQQQELLTVLATTEQANHVKSYIFDLENLTLTFEEAAYPIPALDLQFVFASMPWEILIPTASWLYPRELSYHISWVPDPSILDPIGLQGRGYGSISTLDG